jgi:hypothetical protein
MSVTWAFPILLRQISVLRRSASQALGQTRSLTTTRCFGSGQFKSVRRRSNSLVSVFVIQRILKTSHFLRQSILIRAAVTCFYLGRVAIHLAQIIRFMTQVQARLPRTLDRLSVLRMVMGLLSAASSSLTLSQYLDSL